MENNSYKTILSKKEDVDKNDKNIEITKEKSEKEMERSSKSNLSLIGRFKTSVITDSDIPFKMQMMVISPSLFINLKNNSVFQYYKLGKVLGEGSFGKVIQVTHIKSGLVRAMKLISKLELDPEEKKKIYTEAEILKELDHPNIVKLYEIFEDKDNYYLITELCKGGEILDKISSLNTFSEQMAAFYMKQILSALQYCHSKNIVHRDLKPNNLLLDSNRKNSILKVIDFGISMKFEKCKMMRDFVGTVIKFDYL